MNAVAVLSGGGVRVIGGVAVSENRAPYTADTGEAPEQPANVRTLPMRGFTQADNAYYDGLFGRISPTAYYCLGYIIRATLGYHREGVRLSFKQLGDALGLSRNTAMKGIQELEAAHIIGSDGAERGRTQMRTYVLLPVEEWTLPCHAATSANNGLVCTDATSAKSALVQPTSAKSGLVVSKIGLVAPQTSAKIGLPSVKKDQRNKVSKETATGESDPRSDDEEGADAPAAAAVPSALCSQIAKAAKLAATADDLKGLVRKHMALGADDLVFQAQLAAEWLADPSKNKGGKRTMNLRFLHNWLTKAATPLPPRAALPPFSPAAPQQSQGRQPPAFRDVRGLSRTAAPAPLPASRASPSLSS